MWKDEWVDSHKRTELAAFTSAVESLYLETDPSLRMRTEGKNPPSPNVLS